MKVLGLDIATCTGYSVVEGKKVTNKGIILLNSKLPYKPRFKQFRKELVKLLREHKPDAVVLEGVYSGRNVSTSAYLNNLRGIAIEVIPLYSEFLSAQVKKVRSEVMGNGNSTKEDVFQWVCKKYKIKDLQIKRDKDKDITDSILLATWGLLKLTSEAD